MVFTNLANNGKSLSTDTMFYIDPPRIILDPLAYEALNQTEIYFKNKYPDARRFLLKEKGLSNIVRQVSNRLNQDRGLTEIFRALLSRSAIYAAVVQLAKIDDDIQDQEALYNSVLRYIDKPKKFFLARLLTDILNAKYIELDRSNELRRKRLVELILTKGISIKDGELMPSIMYLLDIFHREGNIPDYLEDYIERGEIPKAAFTSDIKQSIVDYLLKLGVQIDDDWKHNDNQQDRIQGNKRTYKRAYDEYFALAYSRAKNQGAETDDPIDLIHRKGSQSRWNFNINTFGSIEKQGIQKENILAAGALDYIYCIGEQMHVFDVANALVIRWASGMLDIPEGKTAADLYRLHKKREQRSTPEERAMLYKRVLNQGDGKLLQRMVPNVAFTQYWGQLMAEAAQYIQKSERKAMWQSWNNSGISTTHIYQITRDLQYNLTDNMTGMAHLQVTEDYNHLQEALEIINSDDIRNYFGGRRKSVWNVIEYLAKEELGIIVQNETIKTLALEGNKVFQWIANFENNDLVTQEQFETFIKAAEAWIIAQASLASAGTIPGLGKGTIRQTSISHKSTRNGNHSVDEFESSEFERDEFEDW